MSECDTNNTDTVSVVTKRSSIVSAVNYYFWMHSPCMPILSMRIYKKNDKNVRKENCNQTCTRT